MAHQHCCQLHFSIPLARIRQVHTPTTMHYIQVRNSAYLCLGFISGVDRHTVVEYINCHILNANVVSNIEGHSMNVTVPEFAGYSLSMLGYLCVLSSPILCICHW